MLLTNAFVSFAQHVEKVPFNDKDYYLAVKPTSGNIKGVLVLLRGFRDPEVILSETNLPDVAAANDFLTILVSTGQKLYADTVAISRLNQILSHVIQVYKPDTSRFAIGAYEFGGTIALRYAELAQAGRMGIPVVPKAVFAADSPTDLFNFWNRCEDDFKKNFNAGSVGDAKFILERMRSENGDIHTNAARYKELSPFVVSSDTVGNEQFLHGIGVRMYYDTDINWQLDNRRNSFYGTNIPDGSELIKRLMLAGHKNAAFISSRPGMRPNGVRNPNSFSVIEEGDCIRWLKKSLGIFDPVTWKRPYKIDVPADWGRELSAFPPDFAPAIPEKGVEDLFFLPGWGNSHSDEYWSYCYILSLERKQAPDENELKKILAAYYDGLVKRNMELVTPAQVNFKKGTYTGTISMMDYMQKKPIVFNFMVEKKECNTVLFVKISPQPLGHAVWGKLNAVSSSFRCGE